ncbi:MAG: flagellar biosynthesis protein FlhF [Thermodesulfobacteriota bacterium]|nr:flagellar biosynthesis protein FlhF [Thermodesulfobacteriota bacterium]
MRKFTAPTIVEAMRQVKKELGPDAVIFSTRTVKNRSIFKPYSAPCVEITAAIENNFSGNEKKIAKVETKKAREVVTLPWETGPSLIEAVEEGFREIKDMLSPLLNPVEKNNNKEKLLKFPRLKDVYYNLINQGIDKRIAIVFIRKAEEGLSYKAMSEEGKIEIFLANMLLKLIKVSGRLQVKETKGKMVVFIGPTGVGKTTTIAKLATKEKLNDKTVGIITLDNLKVPAKEQHKSYGEIFGIPVEVCENNNKFRKTIQNFQNKDIVFVDTPGICAKNSNQIKALKELLKSGKEMEVHLVVSCTTKERDLYNVAKSFSEVPFQRIVFTKLDESTTYGNILNLAIRFKSTFSFFTYGQNIPGDIELATPERIIDLIFNFTKFGNSFTSDIKNSYN